MMGKLDTSSTKKREDGQNAHSISEMRLPRPGPIVKPTYKEVSGWNWNAVDLIVSTKRTGSMLFIE